MLSSGEIREARRSKIGKWLTKNNDSDVDRAQDSQLVGFLKEAIFTLQ